MRLRRYAWAGAGVALFTGIIAATAPGADRPPKSAPPVCGRWDLTVRGSGGDYPSWLEVRQSGYTTLVGSFVGRFGSARPVSRVEFDGGRVHFTLPPQWESRKADLDFEGKTDGDDALRGETTDDDGKRVTWTARRAPSLARPKPPAWGEPVELFNGKDLSGWKPRAEGKSRWAARDGVLVNAAAGTDLLTERKFTDFKLHTEFRYPAGSNSGVYLRGRYEVQIEDNHGDEPDSHKIGGVYGFLTPSVNAAKKAGEWQTLDVTRVGRVVTVVLNGERVIDRQTIPGVTGGALDGDEAAPGPVLLQGDHGPVDFRRVTLTAGD